MVKGIYKPGSNWSTRQLQFYIRTLVDLEQRIASVQANKELVKKMNASAAKAFNAMKQKVKKMIKEKEDLVQSFLAVMNF